MAHIHGALLRISMPALDRPVLSSLPLQPVGPSEQHLHERAARIAGSSSQPTHCSQCQVLFISFLGLWDLIHSVIPKARGLAGLFSSERF